jgi:hypothetical protein
MIAVPAEATPRRQTRAPHARVPTLTPDPDRPAAQDDGPYGLAQLDTTSEDDRRRLLREAHDETQAALRNASLEDDPLASGRTYKQLAEILCEIEGYCPDAVEAFRSALSGLAPLAPREAREAAATLASLATKVGDWEVAAEAGEFAAEAAAMAASLRATSAGRFEEIALNLNLFRWAAYALARVKRFDRAIEVLELGRARQLMTWLRASEDLSLLETMSPGLAGELREARAAIQRLERSERGGSAASVTDAAALYDRYHAVLAQVRGLPGLEGFLAEPTVADVRDQVPADFAIAFPVTAPQGGLWLLLSAEEHAGVIEAPDARSDEIVKRLVAPGSHEHEVVGYLPAQAASSPNLELELERVAALLGPSLLQPLADGLRRRGIKAVCIVPLGLLGLLPLHAVPWHEQEKAVTLTDLFTVTVAPSAFAWSVCASRASQRRRLSRPLSWGIRCPTRHRLMAPSTRPPRSLGFLALHRGNRR